ncbi:MAG TPA: heterodisulfide reductase-related iron-sulfur binding cluster, partial [Sedimentisphaerales bacterium]|nr:heterodisulfide reductase-related iron-sulfur binding cluster [Sedimentisphaerales bacterium]
YGDVKTARRELEYSVKHLAEAVRSGYKIVCSEPSAAMCLKDELRFFVDSEDAREVSENVYELMGFLLDLFKKGKLKPALKQRGEKYLYHSPCHLLATGDNKASIKLFGGLCLGEITDLNAGCCGIAGTFGMQKKNALLSDKISGSLAKAIADSDIKMVLSECSTCRMQIEHISGRKAIHPVKILAQAWDLL